MALAAEIETTNCVRSLGTLELGASGVVGGVSVKNRKLQQKLLAMGIVAGTPIEVLSVAPFGDPITIKARGYQLSLRRSEANHVEILPEK